MNLLNNTTGRDGGGAALLFNYTAELTESCITGNQRVLPFASSSGVFANWGANVQNNWWGASNGPSGLGSGSGDAVLGSADFSGFANSAVPCGVDAPICPVGGFSSFTTSESCNPPTPTPTATASPAPSTCLVTLINNFTYRNIPAQTVQVLIDMQIMPPQEFIISALKLLTNPIINSPETGISFLWSTTFKVYERIEFPQMVNGSTNVQIWYHVGVANGSDPLGWIPVRYQGQDFIQIPDACASVDAPETLSFPYNRQAAANYAIEQAQQNNMSAPALQRVSRRIAGLSFAFFDYDALSAGTGSAVFVSESIWMGGLPMTIGRADSCDVQPGPADVGWRYCDRTGDLTGLSSPPWDFHESLAEYFTTATLPPGSSGHPNNVLGDKGSQISFSGLTSSNSITAADINNWINLSGGGNINFLPEGLSQFARDNLGIVGRNPIIQAGDYMWIDSIPGDYHGLVVVGWGVTQTCPNALASSGSLYLNYQASLAATDIPEVNGIAQSVPYVADFLGYYPNNLQSPIARPFYCTRYLEPTKSNFSVHNWYFYRLPNVLTLSTADVYVDPLWQWLSSNN